MLRDAGKASTLLFLGVLLANCGGDSTTDRQSDHKRAEAILGTTAPPPLPHHPTKDAVTPPSSSSRQPLRVGPPKIKPWPIPFSAARERETAAYSTRHYGRAVTVLDPKVIVEHYSVTSTAQAVFNTFARDVPDVELHELPGLCSHFLVDRDGTIYQFVPVTLMCRHTVGLNDVAIGIEHVGSSDAEVLGNAAQRSASIELTTWLRCRYAIPIKDVIGHNESLSSPYHHEKVSALRDQTHEDFQPAAMDSYRAMLMKRSC